jgi:hypothetical protein
MSNTSGITALFFLFFTICIICNHHEAKVSNLEKYYKDNPALHAELFDSLIAFCKTHHKDVLLKKSNLKETAIAFHIPFETNNYSPVFYDSAFVRHDPDPRKTGSISIPINVIKKFAESIYTGIAADSAQVFFAEKWNVNKRLNTPGDLRVGIMVSADTSISANCERRIAPNACLKTSSNP